MYKFYFSYRELDLLKSSVSLRINYLESKIKALKKAHDYDNDEVWQELIKDYEKELLSYELLFTELCNVS